MLFLFVLFNIFYMILVGRFEASLAPEEIGPDFRLLDRRGAFGQSRGHWLLHNIMSKARGCDGSKTDTLAQVSTLLMEEPRKEAMRNSS